MKVFEEMQEEKMKYYKTNEEFIKSSKDLKDNSMKIDNILTYLNSVNEIMKSEEIINFSKNQMFEDINNTLQQVANSIHTIADTIMEMKGSMNELNERITDLENQ